MQMLMGFAIFSTRRLEEITRICWSDLDVGGNRVLMQRTLSDRSATVRPTISQRFGRAIHVQPTRRISTLEEDVRRPQRCMPMDCSCADQKYVAQDFSIPPSTEVEPALRHMPAHYRGAGKRNREFGTWAPVSW
jgi:hypothetical protein